ncbi:MAG: RNA polymerase sigma factor [Bacteroidetes bacterium]|nr:RNA polymerase sigma factor [Bacteroidota bacterium]
MDPLNKKPVDQQVEQYREIIEESKLGNRKAQYRLYQLYARAMFNVCFRMMRNREEAEDMLQESFTEAFDKLTSFRYESTFGAWIRQIVVNRCINEIKRKKTELSFFDDLGPFDTETEEPEVDESGLTVDKVKKAMEHLPDGSRMIFSLYLLEGYDHTEIAQILNITESTSKSQYMRARLRVKEVLNTMIHEN